LRNNIKKTSKNLVVSNNFRTFVAEKK